ncbi:hypothetical protein BOX15_Mlig014191g2, partial [Macrostomum lignano]
KADMSILVMSLCLAGSLALLFLAVYLLMTLSDLDCDYLNVREGCDRLNKWVWPEAAVAAAVPILLLLTLHWVLFLLSAPLPCYLIYRCLTLPKGQIGLFDPFEINNRNYIKRAMYFCTFKLVHYLLVFFVLLYSIIYYLVAGE